MSTIIAASTITDSDGLAAGTPFNPTGDFFIVCSKGNVKLEVQIGGAWYGISFANNDYTKIPWVKRDTLIRVQILEAGATYRLVGQIGQTSSASAYNF